MLWVHIQCKNKMFSWNTYRKQNWTNDVLVTGNYADHGTTTTAREIYFLFHPNFISSNKSWFFEMEGFWMRGWAWGMKSSLCHNEIKISLWSAFYIFLAPLLSCFFCLFVEDELLVLKLYNSLEVSRIQMRTRCCNHFCFSEQNKLNFFMSCSTTLGPEKRLPLKLLVQVARVWVLALYVDPQCWNTGTLWKV